MILWELRERVITAQHLHTEQFLNEWKDLCIAHGLAVMKLIIQKESRQLADLKNQIEESTKLLEPHACQIQDKPEFGRHNELLKKEIDKVQKNLRLTKQSKFKPDLDD